MLLLFFSSLYAALAALMPFVSLCLAVLHLSVSQSEFCIAFIQERLSLCCHPGFPVWENADAIGDRNIFSAGLDHSCGVNPDHNNRTNLYAGNSPGAGLGEFVHQLDCNYTSCHHGS